MRNFFFTLFILVGFLANAQSNLTKLINTLDAETQLHAIDPANQLIKIDDKDNKYSNFRHNYLIHNKELYLLLDGTGKIFRQDVLNNKLIQIDSTYFEGNNFGAIVFNWNNRFYSFGGWGFWQFNGGLRYFDAKQKEWDVSPLENEIPFSLKINAIAWPDLLKDKIYLLYNPQNSSYNKIIKYNDSVLLQCFDLKTKLWWSKAKATSFKPANLFNNNDAIQLNTTNGLLIRDESNYTLIDFRNNKLFKSNRELFNQLNSYNQKFKKGFYINKDSIIYFYNPLNDSVVSMVINKSAFFDKKIQLSTDLNVKNGIFITEFLQVKIIIILLIVIIIAVLIIGRKYFNQSKWVKDAVLENKKLSKKIGIDSKVSFSKNLTEQEKTVFETILHNSINNQPTSIDEINTKLGVKNKDVNVQNQLRSEVIQMVNKKFNVFSSSNDILIEREKTSFDKRVNQYKINNRYLNLKKRLS